MTKRRNDKRNSFVSMYQYDIPNSRHGWYQSTYLKLVGATFVCTLIGILTFIHLQKHTPNAAIDENNQNFFPVDHPEFSISKEVRHMLPPTKIFNSNLLPGFREREWENVGIAMSVKEKEFKKDLENIQLLFTELKYLNRLNKLK